MRGSCSVCRHAGAARVCVGCGNLYCDACTFFTLRIGKRSPKDCSTCSPSLVPLAVCEGEGRFAVAARTVARKITGGGGGSSLGANAKCAPCDDILQQTPDTEYDELKAGVVYLNSNGGGGGRNSKVVVKILPAIGNRYLDTYRAAYPIAGIGDFDLLGDGSFDVETAGYVPFPIGLYKMLYEILLTRLASRWSRVHQHQQQLPFSVQLHDAGLVSVPEDEHDASRGRAALGWIATEHSGLSMHAWMIAVAAARDISAWNRTLLMIRGLRGVLKQLRKLHDAGIAHNDLRPDNVTTTETDVGATLDQLRIPPLSLIAPPTTLDEATQALRGFGMAIPDASSRIIDFGRADLLPDDPAIGRRRSDRFRDMFTDEEWIGNHLGARTIPTTDFEIGRELAGAMQEQQDLRTTIEAPGGVWHLDALLSPPADGSSSEGRISYILAGLRRVALGRRSPLHRAMFDVISNQHIPDVTSEEVGPIVDIIYFFQSFIRVFALTMRENATDRIMDIAYPAMIAEVVSVLTADDDSIHLYMLQDWEVQHVCETYCEDLWAMLQDHVQPPPDTP